MQRERINLKRGFVLIKQSEEISSFIKTLLICYFLYNYRIDTNDIIAYIVNVFLFLDITAFTMKLVHLIVEYSYGVDIDECSNVVISRKK